MNLLSVCSVNVKTKGALVCFDFKLVPHGAAVLVLSLSMKTENKVGCIVTQSSLVHDVIDTGAKMTAFTVLLFKTSERQLF